MPPADTTDAAQRVQDEILRRMGPEERFFLADQMIAFARRAAFDGIRARHPEYTERDAHLALVRLLYGDELVLKAWPGEPLRAP